MICKNCGGQVEDGMRFCENCGAPVEPDWQETGGAEYPNGGDYQQGNPNDGGYQQGYPNDGNYQQGYPNDGNYQQGYPNDGNYQQGYPNDGDYQQGYPNDGNFQQDPGYGNGYYDPNGGYQQPRPPRKPIPKKVLVRIGLGAAAVVILISAYFLVSSLLRASSDKKNLELYEEYSENLEKTNEEAEQELLSSLSGEDSEE